MFKIGEFSRVAQVSTHLLRYYDEIGLFSPSDTDPQTGYRYYSANQLPQLNRIIVLKDLGFSLDQIAKLMQDNISSSEIRGMLTLKKAQIEQTLIEEFDRLKRVEFRLEQLDDENGFTNSHDVILKSIPDHHYLSLRQITKTDEEIAKMFDVVFSVGRAHTFQTQSNCLAVVHSPPKAELDWELGYVVDDPNTKSIMVYDEKILSVRHLPTEETMATAVHIGTWGTGYTAYNRLGVWIEENGYQICGAAREVFLHINPFGSSEDNVIEFQLPVEKAT